MRMIGASPHFVLPASARQSLVFAVELPSHIASPMVVPYTPAAKIPARPASIAGSIDMQSTSSSLPRSLDVEGGAVAAKDDTLKALVDAYVSFTWHTPAMAYPVTCQYRCQRALVVLPHFVLAVLPPASCRAGQTFTVQYVLLNCTSAAMDVSLLINNTEYVDIQRASKQATAMFGNVAREDGLAGLVCLDQRVRVGVCEPSVARTVCVSFRGLHGGVFDLSAAQVVQHPSAQHVPVRFSSCHIMVAP